MKIAKKVFFTLLFMNVVCADTFAGWIVEQKQTDSKGRVTDQKIYLQ